MGAPGSSWGLWPRHAHRVQRLHSRFEALPDAPSMLAWGNGRSYGDVCQNEGGLLLATRGLDRYIAFDEQTGIVECEAGVLLSELIELALPRGWFLPVSPGTAYVTVGGAIANDVHGKNHHRAASFGNHLLEFELLRSDGNVLRCSPTRHRDWFTATIGGLGLTGLIRRARLQLRRVPGPWIRGDSQRFGSLPEFFALSEASDATHEYTVAWIDSSARGRALGRGIFTRGNHAPAEATPARRRALRLPFTPPFPLVNRATLKAFNALYYRRPGARVDDGLWHYRPFFHPLDAVLDWNRLYGPRGFYQYQCVVPDRDALPALEEMLRRIADTGLGSFLVVLKRFGHLPSLGLLSFPRPGATLALDFPNRGAPTLALLEALDAITRSVGGAVYPAKDARMSAAAFRDYFPRWQAFADYVDPQFSSSFWRRVSGDAAR